MHRDHHPREWCGCCDLKSAAMVAGTFVMTVSFAQFMLIFFHLIAYCVADSYVLGMLLKTVLGGYVGLASLDVIMIVMSIIMMDRNARQENKSVLLVWQIFMAIYILYEVALNISFFVLMGGMGSGMGTGMGTGMNTMNTAMDSSAVQAGQAMFAGMIVYWLLKMFMYIACMVAVHWRWHELMHLKDAALATLPIKQFAAPVAQPAVYQTLPMAQPAVQVAQPNCPVHQQPSANYVITQY